MSKIDITSGKLVLQAGSVTLALDKDSGRGQVSRKILLWERKPDMFAISDIDDIAVRTEKDGVSGATIHHAVMHRRGGEITVLTTEEAPDAAATVKRLRAFLGWPA